MSELTDALPCPFCGSAQHIHAHEGSTFRWMLAECGECGAQGPEVRVQTLGDGTYEEWQEQGRKDAIAEWNSRSLLAAHEAKGVRLDAQDRFCDSHCTWRDHHPDCPRADGVPVAPVARVYRQSSNGSAGVMWLNGYQPVEGDELYALGVKGPDHG